MAEVERLTHLPYRRGDDQPEYYRGKQRIHLGCSAASAKVIGENGVLFAQTMSRDAQGMVNEAKRLNNAVRELW